MLSYNSQGLGSNSDLDMQQVFFYINTEYWVHFLSPWRAWKQSNTQRPNRSARPLSSRREHYPHWWVHKYIIGAVLAVTIVLLHGTLNSFRCVNIFRSADPFLLTSSLAHHLRGHRAGLVFHSVYWSRSLCPASSVRWDWDQCGRRSIVGSCRHRVMDLWQAARVITCSLQYAACSIQMKFSRCWQSQWSERCASLAC